MRSKDSTEAEQAATKRPPLVSRRASKKTPAGASGRAPAATKPMSRRGTIEPVPPVKLDPIRVQDGVVSLNGYGVRIAVEKGHLILADGIGTNRRAGRFSRATCGIKRLVVRGSAFFITGDALAWLTDIGAAFLNLGFDGELLAAWSPPGPNDARIRRAQALAPWTQTGLAITKRLLHEKLLGQAQALERFIPGSGDAVALIRGSLADIERETDPAVIRHAEGKAAEAYWRTLEPMPLTFAKHDSAKIPAHWRTVGPRMSPLTSRAQGAASPAHALLNYLYAILESETRIACISAGLDPAMGLFHADRDNRDSLALDLMEPVRPHVDAWLISLLRQRVWTPHDFGEIRSGVCRVLPEVAHMLAETALTWQRLVTPYARDVAKTLLDAKLTMPSSQLWYPPKPRQASTTTAKANRVPSSPLSLSSRRASPRPRRVNACRQCGVVLEQTNRKLCDDCYTEYQTERIKQFNQDGFAGIAMRTNEGVRPAQSPTAMEKMRRTVSRWRAENTAWEQQHGAARDVEHFRSTILPKLQNVSVYAMAKVTGFSSTYCSGIKAGKYIPHPRVWETLAHNDEHITAHRERAEGGDIRRQKARERRYQQVAWERAHDGKPDVAIFTQALLPHVHRIALGEMVRATGMAQTYCSAVKRGEKVPHPMHWEALARLAGIIWPPESQPEDAFRARDSVQ